LRTVPSLVASKQEKQRRKSVEPNIRIVQSDPSERTVQLSQAALNIRLTNFQAEETFTLNLDKLALDQLYILQRETQMELQDREELVHDELHLVNQEKECYVEICANLTKEKEEVKQESAQLKIVVKEVMAEVTEEEYRADQPFEEGLTKVKELVQELRTKILDLESRVAPATPPEEIAAREEEMKRVIASVEAYEAECMERYTHCMQVWNQWTEDEELKAVSAKVKEVQDELERLQAFMMNVPIKEKMVTMQQEKQLRARQEALSKAQRLRATFIEPLQETILQTSMEITETHA